MARILEGAWVLLYSISIAVLMVWWAQVPAWDAGRRGRTRRSCFSRRAEADQPQFARKM